MRHVERSVLVTHPADRMYRLVAGVERYPEFLPWCVGAQVEADGPTAVRARVELAFRAVRSSFTTRNVLHPHSAIELELVDGPFRRLHGRWTFTPLGAEGSKVALSLSYQFSSTLLGRAIAPAFERVAASLVDAFVYRADHPDGRMPFR